MALLSGKRVSPLPTSSIVIIKTPKNNDQNGIDMAIRRKRLALSSLEYARRPACHCVRQRTDP